MSDIQISGGGGAGGDSIYTDTYANIPAASNDGDLFLPSDGYSIYRDTGAAWAPWGLSFPLETPPVVADWTWVNQGGASATDTSGAILLSAPTGVGDNFRILKKSAPSTPYVITLLLLMKIEIINSIFTGFVWRQSSDGKLVVFGLYNSAGFGFHVTKWTDASTYSADYARTTPIHGIQRTLLWLRCEDNATNRICSYSLDGQNFTAYHTVGRTDFLTADEVGFAININTAGTTCTGLLLSWKEE